MGDLERAVYRGNKSKSAVYGGRKSKRVLFMGDMRVREHCLWGT